MNFLQAHSNSIQIQILRVKIFVRKVTKTDEKTSSIKVIDMTGKEERILTGYQVSWNKRKKTIKDCIKGDTLWFTFEIPF